MTDKAQLIKREIERRINLLQNGNADPEVMKRVEGVLLAYNGILQFIDSIPEEHNEDLEEYYTKEFLPKEWFAKPGQRTISQFNFFTAQHFAEWQKQQMKEVLQTEYEKGRFDMREEMMKDSISCNVYWYDGFRFDYTQEQQDDILLKLGVDVGDKVKIIIVRED
jgi:hypothetical protein